MPWTWLQSFRSRRWPKLASFSSMNLSRSGRIIRRWLKTTVAFNRGLRTSRVTFRYWRVHRLTSVSIPATRWATQSFSQINIRRWHCWHLVLFLNIKWLRLVVILEEQISSWCSFACCRQVKIDQGKKMILKAKIPMPFSKFSPSTRLYFVLLLLLKLIKHMPDVNTH